MASAVIALPPPSERRASKSRRTLINGVNPGRRTATRPFDSTLHSAFGQSRHYSTLKEDVGDYQGQTRE